MVDFVVLHVAKSIVAQGVHIERTRRAQ